MCLKPTGIFILFAVILLCLIGCSNSGQPVVPGDNPESRETGETLAGHSPWGFWQFICDPEAGTIEFVELRDAQLHLNALRFLEPPVYLYLTLESAPQFSGNTLTVDIGLRHPFLGFPRFTGFDACGILIADATHYPVEKPGLLIGGEGDTRLLNADGYSRWWNPAEFPHNETMFGYNDGLLGTPDDVADFSGILNGYKYFCDDLTYPDAPMSLVDPEGRGVFSAGQKNVRTYIISLENSLVFNYAIDACWAEPVDPDPPVQAPDDFGQNANRPETWNVSVNIIESKLYYDDATSLGQGWASFDIDVYDWFNPEMNTVTVYSLGAEFDAYQATLTNGGVGYSTYEVELLDAIPTSTDPVIILIEVACEVSGYGGKLPGETVCAYFLSELEVIPGLPPDELPDICTNWGDETGCYMHWQNGQTIHWIFTQLNFASDSQGNVWMWCQRTSNALSRCLTPFNGDWGTMYEEYLTGGFDFWIFNGSTIDVSLTPTFDGGLIAGCSPTDYYDSAYPENKNPLSIAWWDGTEWHDKDANQWRIHDVESSNQIARRINGYRDSTGRFHAFCHIDGEFIDFYGDVWQGEWEFANIGSAPVGQADNACQTRTDFVAESSDGYIYVCWVDDGVKVARCQAGTSTWDVIFEVDDTDYDSPTIYVDNQDRVFLAARYFISTEEDQIHLFKSTNGTDFGTPDTIYAEPGIIVDPCYLTLKGDAVDHLFLTFPYRPGDEGAYAAIIASTPGGEVWTEVCVLTDPIIKHPGLAIRPDGSLEVGYGIPKNGDPNSGSIDNPYSEQNYLYGRSHAGFVD